MFNFDLGIGSGPYLAHITIGIGRHTLWLNIVSTNWKSFALKRDFRNNLMGSFSVFTFAITN